MSDRCRDALTRWAERERDQAREAVDDGSRAYAVRQTGETAVRQVETTALRQVHELLNRAPIGTNREKIRAAAVRRELSPGSRVQVFFLKGPRRDEAPDVRTVTKQTSYEMVTTSPAVPKGSHLTWAGQKAERDTSGYLIIRDSDDTPFVAYRPLAPGDTPATVTPPIHRDLEVRYTEARNTSDSAVLDDIAAIGIPLNRSTVAQNPHTTPARCKRSPRTPTSRSVEPPPGTRTPRRPRSRNWPPTPTGRRRSARRRCAGGSPPTRRRPRPRWPPCPATLTRWSERRSPATPTPPSPRSSSSPLPHPAEAGSTPTSDSPWPPTRTPTDDPGPLGAL